MAPINVQQTFALVLRNYQAGRLQEAEKLCRQILDQEPAQVDTLHFLGVIVHQIRQDDTAVDLIRRAIALRPESAEAHSNLGNVLREKGRLDEAIAACRQAIALNPNFPEAHVNLASALIEKGQLDEAIAASRRAVALRPGYAEAYGNLGNALKFKGQLDEAIEAWHQAIAFNPNLSDAHNNLGEGLEMKGLPDRAVAACQQAIALDASMPEAQNNLGNALKDKGQLDEAIAAFRRALALRPDYADVHSNLIFAMHYHPGFDARAIAEELRRWNRQHAEPLRTSIQVHSNDRRPDRRLRIGYVSADFFYHVSAFFLSPLLKHHDRQQVELICYSHVVRPDAMTREFQQQADVWRNTVGVSDEQAARQIREDRIDILVDLKTHTAGNRLRVFARKPAPIQVTWLGNPGGTGLSAIDYRLSDPYLDPVGMDESVYSEQTIRLPDTFWCYDPLDGRDIPVNPLPALGSGVFTFGCLNNFCKINDDVLTLWAKVLRQVENSRLLLLAPVGSHRLRLLERFKQEGIDPDRVEFVAHQSRPDYLKTYHRIDLGLDTFPCNGHTTSLDSFWMGVPLVTLVGSRVFGRAGWSQLSNLGLAELAGQTSEQFVSLAVELAKDLPRVAQLRSTLRRCMEQSPLMDAPKFTRNIEAAYRRMWQAWCE